LARDCDKARNQLRGRVRGEAVVDVGKVGEEYSGARRKESSKVGKVGVEEGEDTARVGCGAAGFFFCRGGASKPSRFLGLSVCSERGDGGVFGGVHTRLHSEFRAGERGRDIRLPRQEMGLVRFVLTRRIPIFLPVVNPL